MRVVIGDGNRILAEALAAALEACDDAVTAIGTRACPVDHGTGSRSQMLIEATSMVPW